MSFESPDESSSDLELWHTLDLYTAFPNLEPLSGVGKEALRLTRGMYDAQMQQLESAEPDNQEMLRELFQASDAYTIFHVVASDIHHRWLISHRGEGGWRAYDDVVLAVGVIVTKEYEDSNFNSSIEPTKIGSLINRYVQLHRFSPGYEVIEPKDS